MKKIAFLALLLYPVLSWAQRANDCRDAIVVCGNSQIASNSTGFGTQELDATTNPCSFEEVNSLWLRLGIDTNGTLAFEITPNSSDLSVDYDFYVFGPNFGCGNFTDPVRCSTTNPLNAQLTYNTTGLGRGENDISEGPGPDGNSFVSALDVLAGETYYLLIDRPHGTGGFSLRWTGTAEFLPSPEIQEPSDIEICPSDTVVEVDLTTRASQITESPEVQINYFRSLANAFDFTIDIRNPERFEFSGTREDIYVRVSNPNGCFEITDFSVIPLIFGEPPSLEYIVCDTDRDGLGSYSTIDITSDIESTLSNTSGFNITLHPDELDALSGTNEIQSRMFHTSENLVYARISSLQLAGCFTTFPIALVLNENPYSEVIDLVQCDVDETNSIDGITRINLTEAFPELSEPAVSFYETIAGRDADSPISNPTSYTNQNPFNDLVYYKVIIENCISIGEIALRVDPTIVSLNTISPILMCDNDSSDNLLEGTFDLDEIRQNSYAGLDVAFYANLDDVTLEQNKLPDVYNTETTTIFARLETSNQCQGVEELALVVKPLPEINLEQSYTVCTDGEPLIVSAPSGFDEYTWYSSTSGTFQEAGTAGQLEIFDPGNFRLKVGRIHQQDGQRVLCTSDFDFVVTPSNKATFVDILIEEFSTDNSIEIIVQGDGEYEYSLDGESYQDIHIFRNIPAGLYTIYVRDKNGCGISEEDISVIGYPKFFTPNADGKNDVWQLIGASNTNIVKTISIFDRYGKLLQVLGPDAAGWDGMYDGTPLPASDYWFRIAMVDGKDFKGHFSLKR